MYDIVGKRNLWFAISAILTIPGVLFIVLGGLRPSIDFTGGTEWEVRYADQPSAAEMTATLAELGYPDALVTELSDGFLRIRTSRSICPGADVGAVASASASASVVARHRPPSRPRRAVGEPVVPAPSPSAWHRRRQPTAEPSPPPIAEGTGSPRSRPSRGRSAPAIPARSHRRRARGRS